MTRQERFQSLRAKYLSAYVAWSDYHNSISLKYGQPQWASRTEKKKEEQLRARTSRAADPFFRLLEDAPRNWGSGIPSHWVLTKLSYEDAFAPKSQSLSVVPPPAYGYSDREMQEFARGK